jgi:hypothetical protein
MKTNLPISLLSAFLLSLVALPSRTVAESAAGQDQQPEKSISVEVAGGRTFTGQLDARTDPAELWLRSRRGSAVLLRPIPWDRISQVHVADQDLSGEELRQIVKTIKPEAAPPKEAAAAIPNVQGPMFEVQTSNPQSPIPNPQQKSLILKGSTRPGGFLSVTGTPPPTPAETPRVCSLAIEAGVANWNADVEVDGLLVRVYPLDGTGTVVPVRGMLQFDLTGERGDESGPLQPFTTLGQWSRPVRFEDFGPQGAVFRLPFQGVHPEFNLSVAPLGAVHARLNVPGQGSFDATDSMVRIRPYSAVRDQLQLSTGRRFFPQERTGGGHR